VKIAQFYSHLNGYEHIMHHKPEMWSELSAVVEAVDAEASKTKVSKESRTQGRVFYSPTAMNIAYKSELNARGWHERRTSYWVTDDHVLILKTMRLEASEQKQVILNAWKTPISSYNQTDFVKNRIELEVQFGKYSFVAYDLFVKHMAFFIGEIIDVGIELLPMKALQSEMSSGVPYYESAIYDLLRQGRNTPAVPLVVVGVVP
jgi:hypothetical protein